MVTCRSPVAWSPAAHQLRGHLLLTSCMVTCCSPVAWSPVAHLLLDHLLLTSYVVTCCSRVGWSPVAHHLCGHLLLNSCMVTCRSPVAPHLRLPFASPYTENCATVHKNDITQTCLLQQMPPPEASAALVCTVSFTRLIPNWANVGNCPQTSQLKLCNPRGQNPSS